MYSLLTLLESDTFDWKLNPNRYKDFLEVADKYDYKFKSHKTISEVKEFLISQLKDILSGKEIDFNSFSKIEDQISFKYFAINKKRYKDIFFFISALRYVINRLDSYTDSIDAWKKARDYLEAYLSISKSNPNNSTSLFKENEKISDSIKFLNKNGFPIEIVDGNLLLAKDIEDRLLESVLYRLHKIGENALYYTIACISKKYNHQSKRFYLRPEPALTDQYIVDVPWGYIFNLSLRCLNNVKNTKATQREFLKCIDLVKHYFCVQRIQIFNKYSDISHRHDTILSAIQKNILYDQHYSIDQISSNHIERMIGGMFLSKEFESFGLDFSLHVLVLRFVSSHSTFDRPFEFYARDLQQYFSYNYKLEEINETLNTLSFNLNELNKDYLKPEEIHKKNYFEKPFVKIDDKFVYLNKLFNSFGFYSSLMKQCSQFGVNGNLMGKIAEGFIEKELENSNIVFHANKEYRISKDIRNELKINSQKRECDYIIETSDTVIFLELKRKTLTSESRSGNSLKSIVDLSQSLFHALAQTGCHEYILRRNKKIEFIDGTSIELNGRDIERVALSLFGFFGIQDGFFVQQILATLIGSTVDSGNPAEDEKVNKYLIELYNQYSTDVFCNEYSHDISKYMNCRFFSVPQILEMLSNSSNNEEFKSELNRTRHIFTGCKDWFKEYQYVRQLHEPKSGKGWSFSSPPHTTRHAGPHRAIHRGW